MDSVPKPLFRVKRYSHPKYKFLVRGKVLGKWKRRYFETEAEAIAFSQRQNAHDQHGNGETPSEGASREMDPGLPRLEDQSQPERSGSAADFSKLAFPAYLGPRIERYLGDSWCMHLPFAYDLMRELEPRVFVELGVKEGESYFSFCQSAAENKINVRCYGIDSWQGDIQTGALNPEIQREVTEYNWRYSSFSELKMMLFAEALAEFPDASIDLLHIDGTHTYAEVKGDFESWLPKLTPRGIILFHDVIPRDGGFGVWKLWEEIAREGNSFLFEFGYGLGVWKKQPLAPDDPPFIRRLLRATNADRQDLNAYYANAAVALALWHNLQKQSDGVNEAARLRSEAEERSNQVAHFQRETEEKAKHLALLQDELKEKLEQVAHFQGEAEEKAKHLVLLQGELKEKSERMAHFQSEAEEKTRRIVLLQGELEKNSQQMAIFQEEARERSRQLAAFEAQAEQRSGQIAQLQRDLEERSAQIALFRRESDEQSELPERLKNELRATSERLARTKDELLDARWEALTLRGTLLRKSDSAEAPSARILELENRAEAVASERDHLRAMLVSLQNDLEQERLSAQAIQGELAAAQQRFAAAAKQAELVARPSILQNIDRIHGPPLVWRIAQGLGLLKLAAPGVPRTASERRTLARELKGDLREIQKALSSATIAPEDAALCLKGLLRLRKRTGKILDSLTLRALFAAKEPVARPEQSAPPLAETSSSEPPATVLFDAQWYLEQNPDVAAAGFDPLEHYLKWGAHENRDPNPLFHASWYLAKNADVAGSGLSPLEHYYEWGAQEGRDPNPLFSTHWYLEVNPDIRASGINPLQHYLEYGAKELRNPHALFDARWYVAENPEAEGSNPLAHYLSWGGPHGRSPHPLFDPTWYLEQSGADPAARANPLRHYLEVGASQGLNPHPLFDSAWYGEQNRGLGSGINLLQHYLECGAREDRDPHPLFSSKWYLEQDPLIDRHGISPLQHYVLYGAHESRSPHPLFDPNYYRTTYLDPAGRKDNPLLHYLTIGSRAGYWPNSQFDPDLYLQLHPDVAEAGLEPFTHYVVAGQSEGRAITRQKSFFVSHQPDFRIPHEPAFPAAQSLPDVKAIAFYLPQFHQIPENDAWWGHGFTEWSNVRKGEPNFRGHYQPHVPSHLGYYDLSDPEVLEKQTQLARAAGIYGFCFYYYWFGGQTLLDLPIRRMLETGQPCFPFCICWANENWTRRWDGNDSEILIAQQHSAEDDLAFIKKVEPVLRVPNYIRVDGRPMLLVYRPSLLPEPSLTLDRWRKYCRKTGLGELHLVMVRSFSEQAADSYGFDATVQFPPHLQANPVTALISEKHEDFTGYIYDYVEARGSALAQFSSPSPCRLYPGVMPSWDNTARQRTRSTIWVNSSPEAYFEWLSEAAQLARVKFASAERFVFINAWNEWAEGCHLEPDERFGYAWLNATSLALRESPPSPNPEPPVERRVDVSPLTGRIRLVLSVLFYHRDDIIPGFLRSLLPQILAASSSPDLSCDLFLSFNYEPAPEVLAGLQKLISEILPSPDSVHIINNGFNLGFGAGHNAIFEKAESDVFVVLNSDLQIQDNRWLEKFAERFRTSSVALVGLAENASRLREDGCGVPAGEAGETFDFVDGSVLAVRSDLAAQFGLFSPSFDYFYFEDVDLNLRYRQMGLRIETLDIPCFHERSSSTRLLPKFAVESVLNQNRARFFERWGKYLTTRCLTNRLGLRFREADRQLQCASFAAIFGLLAEHPTAVLDLWGVHEQLIPLFHHPRIRLIPWWQTPRHEDYLRWYELSLDVTNRSSCAITIAEQMLVDPAFETARRHLESLVSHNALERARPNRAVVYLSRPQILFEGRQPEAGSLVAAQGPLLQKGFEIQYYSEYGALEVREVPQRERQNWKYAARSNGLDLLTDLASADILVTTDGWAAELGQLLNKKTMIWFGATSPGAAIWNAAQTHPFVDPSLNCLGCHERFGHAGRNVCLRGDEACMSSRLNQTFVEAVEAFLDGKRVATTPTISQANAVTSRVRRSDQEKLEAWPATSAGSVLVLTPVNPTLDPAVIRRARELAERTISGMRGCRIVYDDTGEAPPRGSTFPHRLAAMTPLRQAMIDRHLRDERWVFWVDADLVEYPANLVEELISRAEGGIAAPLVLMEGDVSEPAYPAGFGPGRFYDIAGFIEHGRWARFTQPYFDQPGPVYRLDSVGCCYLVNADLYRWGATHELDYASKAFIAENCDWPDDAITQNQSGPANSFTDHYSVCEFARKVGLPVQAFADLIAYHQKSSAT